MVTFIILSLLGAAIALVTFGIGYYTGYIRGLDEAIRKLSREE